MTGAWQPDLNYLVSCRGAQEYLPGLVCGATVWPSPPTIAVVPLGHTCRRLPNKLGASGELSPGCRPAPLQLEGQMAPSQEESFLAPGSDLNVK